MKKVRKYEIILQWLRSKLSHSQFLILSGILVGITSGLAGVLLKTVVHWIHFFITNKVHFEYQVIFYLLFPFLGIVLTTSIVITFFKGQDRKGIGAILYEIARNSSIVSSVKMYSQMVQSAVTVGLGGSAGLESPIAVTGAAIGSNFARTYNLNYKERTLLLAAGATAGIASAFNAPIAGIMFAFEILLTGVVFTDFIPLVVAAVCGSLISRIILQEDVLFRFHAREAFNYHNTFYYIVLGIACGFYARYFVVVMQYIEHQFNRLKLSRLRKAIVGGVALSLLCVLLPPLFGEGYYAIKAFTDGQGINLINNSFLRYVEYSEWHLLIFLLLICLVKAFATSITIYSGGNGGSFAPSLFAGGTLGFLFANVCRMMGFHDVPVTNIVLVGMAGVMSGVLYAPLTAIFLIAESSLGYDLFIPLMIVSVISYLIAKWYSPISPDLKSLAEQRKIFTRRHDENLMSSLHTADLIDTESEAVRADITLGELQEFIKKGKKNIFAVVNEHNKLQGVITLDDLRQTLFSEHQPEDFSISKVMNYPIAVVHAEDEIPEIVKIFDQSDVWQLPVLNKEEQFVGFISKSSILTQYRDLLKEYSEL